MPARGQFTYEDHGTPWSTIGRNLNVTLYRSDVINDYRGGASFSNGTIKIQRYEPFSAAMRSRFKIVDGKVMFDRIDLTSDGATSVLDGVVDLRRWPEQIYRDQVAHRLPDAEGHLLPPRSLQRVRPGGLPGHVPSLQGRPRAEGHVHQPAGRRERLALPEPARHRALAAGPARDHRLDAASVYGGTARFDYRMAPIGKKGVPTIATWDVQYRDVDLSRLTDFLETRGLRLAGRATGRNRLPWPLGGWAMKRGEGVVGHHASAGRRDA